MTKQRLLEFLTDVVAQGESLLRKEKRGSDRALATHWYPRVMTVFHVLGSRADPWKFAVAKCPSEHNAASTEKLLGVLSAIQEAIEKGMLDEIEETAQSDAFAAMLDHAERLVSDGLLEAGGSVAKTVLLEHLQDACESSGSLTDQYASAEALVQALYLRGELSKEAAGEARKWIAIGERCERGTHPPEASEVVQTIEGITRLIHSPK